MKIGLTAFDDNRWMSVSRTFRFYQRTLEEAFDLEVVGSDNTPARSAGFDVLVNFRGSISWTQRLDIKCAVIFAMHGGLIVDRAFLEEHLDKCRAGDRFIVNCSSDKQILAEASPELAERTDLLPLPVSARPRPSRSFCRQALRLGEDVAVMGFVARLLPAKNLHGFLQMVTRVKEELAPRPVRAIIVGDYWGDYPVLPFCTSEYRLVIKELVDALALKQELLYFPAVLSDDQLDLVYGAMDVLVHPTYGIDENFGYVPVEAMAAGIPVIASAYGGLKDTVQDCKTGRLMPTWVTAGGIRIDTETGVAAVLDLLTDPALHEEMARNALNHARSAYSEEVCRAALISSVRRAVGKMPTYKPAEVKRWPIHDAHSLLPNVRRGWHEFAPLVSHYVSSAVPNVRSGDTLYLPARLKVDGSGNAELDDPAWPMKDKLDSQRLAILTAVPYGTKAMVTDEWPDRMVAASLIADGWLAVQKIG